MIHAGPRLTTAPGEDIGTTMDIGVRSWGNDPDGRDVSLIGCFQMRGEISQRLLDALPAVFVLSNDEWDTPLIALLADEIARDDPGQQAVLDRLFDPLLIAAIRAHLARLGDEAPASCANRSPPSRRSPPESATATASRSAAPSSAFAARVQPAIGTTSRASSAEIGYRDAGQGPRKRRALAEIGSNR